MSGFVVQGPKSDDRDSSGSKNGLYPIIKDHREKKSPLSFVISYLDQHVRILKLYYSETRDTSHVQIGVGRQRRAALQPDSPAQTLFGSGGLLASPVTRS